MIKRKYFFSVFANNLWRKMLYLLYHNHFKQYKIAEILRKKGIKLNRNEMENLVDEIAAEIKGEIGE